MSFVVIRNKNKHGCYALEASHGDDLVLLKNELERTVNSDVEVFLISNPSAYGEYAPYNIVETKESLLSIAKMI